ncbi:MAG: hypothetical protein Tsb0014_32280 [Pleurocapsa sp.]
MNQSPKYSNIVIAIAALFFNFCLVNKLLDYSHSDQNTDQILASTPQQFKLLETSQQDTDFSQFLDKFRQKISDRDAQFVRNIMISDIQLSFGSQQEIEQLNLENPDAISWLHLEKAIAVGCSPIQINSSEPVNWQCPPLEAVATEKISPWEQVFIVGKQVNVRSQPKLESSIVQRVSEEVVRFDDEGLSQLSTRQQETMSTIYSWIPVILANGQHGYVSSRYAYQLSDYRVLFAKLDGKWRLVSFLAGD